MSQSVKADLDHVYSKGYANAGKRQRQYTRGGFKSEDAGEFLCCQIKYSKSLPLAENLNKLFTVLGEKFEFSAQDSDLEYLIWQRKNPPVSSDSKSVNFRMSFLIFF